MPFFNLYFFLLTKSKPIYEKSNHTKNQRMKGIVVKNEKETEEKHDEFNGALTFTDAFMLHALVCDTD